MFTLKILHTLYVAVLVLVYWRYYGPQNFLWFSDIALFGSVIAMWTENSLVASTQALSVFLLELAWGIDILFRMLLSGKATGLSDYMFRTSVPLVVRLMSLFHVWLPWLLLWMVMRYGYDPRALPLQTGICWIVIVASYFVSAREENMNWVFGIGSHGRPRGCGPKAWLAVLMLGMPLCIYLPTHFFLRWIAGS